MNDQPRPRFRCPYCGSRRYRHSTSITAVAWLIAVLMVLSCFLAPFFWLPLLVLTENNSYCAACGIKLG